MNSNITIKRNIWLDIFKLFLCLLVISIHFVGEAYWYFPVYRLAVPMFFMISGYFNYNDSEEVCLNKSKIFIKRCVKYMLIGFLIYIVYDFIGCYINGNGVGYFFTTLFYENFFHEFFILNRPITYSGYQLWFLIALFVVSLLHYLIVKFKKQKWYYFIVPIGIAIFLFFSGYMRLLQNTDMPIRFTRNALVFGLPMFALGYSMAKFNFHKKSWFKYIYLALGVLFFFLQVLESKIIVMEMYFSTILSAVFLLQFFLGLKPIKCDWYYNWFGKSMSFYVYILHVAVGITLGQLFSFSNLIVKSFVILGVSIAIYEICFLFVKLIKYFSVKYKKNDSKNN